VSGSVGESRWARRARGLEEGEHGGGVGQHRERVGAQLVAGGRVVGVVVAVDFQQVGELFDELFDLHCLAGEQPREHRSDAGLAGFVDLVARLAPAEPHSATLGLLLQAAELFVGVGLDDLGLGDPEYAGRALVGRRGHGGVHYLALGPGEATRQPHHLPRDPHLHPQLDHGCPELREPVA
jgi:hypothetical protein